jgi:hypothetical protein
MTVVFKEFNPLDYENLTRHCVDELMRREASPLPVTERFEGAGVYALFYQGHFPAYEKVHSPDCTWPIYVGKAVPKGGRKGLGRRRAADYSLYSRLEEHHRSIREAADLRADEFRCRFMVVTPLWISMTERFLLETYRPLWNVALDGFGNHDPGSGRHHGQITWWDALHPGRTWAGRLRQTRTRDQALERVADYLTTYELIPRRFTFDVVAEPDSEK